MRKKRNKAIIYTGIILVVLAGIVVFSTVRQLGLIAEVDELLWLIALVVVPAFIFWLLMYVYVYYGFGPQEGIYRSAPQKQMVSLTFDDGPSSLFTPAILDTLKEKNVKATFFLVGRHVLKYPDIARRIVAEGHEIGNHTFSHRDFVPSTRRQIVYEVKKCQRAIFQVTGVNTDLIRPPRGIYSNAVRELLIQMGYKIVLWNLSSLDWRGLSAEKMVRRIKRFVRPGATILFHDSGAIFKKEGASRENTVDALSAIIDLLRDKGYEIVPVSQLVGITCYFERLQDPPDVFDESRVAG